MLDYKRFTELMGWMGETFGTKISQARCHAYFGILSDLETDEFERAVRIALRSNDFLPSPKQIFDLARGSPEDNAIRALARVVDAMQRHGRYKSVDFGDPITHAAVRACGGWLHLMDASARDFPWVRREFIKAYVVYSRRGVTSEEGAPLMGVHGAAPVSIGAGGSAEVRAIGPGENSLTEGDDDVE
jgi:hypothetical protein